MLLLILMSLLQVATSTVYYVEPDSENYEGHNTLQYYHNAGKLSSNTQLNFVPGVFKLWAPLIISNVSNFSMIGSSTGQTTISCNNRKAGVFIAYSDTIKIENMAIKYCGYKFNTLYKWKSEIIISNLMIVTCANLFIENSTFYSNYTFGLSVHDPIGCSNLHQVSSNAILFDIHSVTGDVNLTIVRFNNIPPTDGYAVSFVVDNHSSKIKVVLSQMIITSCAAIKIESSTCSGVNDFRIYQLKLEGRDWPAKSAYGAIFFKIVGILFINS